MSGAEPRPSPAPCRAAGAGTPAKERADEADAIRRRYLRRQASGCYALYSPLDPAVYMVEQEKERVLVRWIKRSGLAPVHDKRLLEIGCGEGRNLLQLLRLGFRPENLVGNDLLEERARSARERLPALTTIVVGDAATLDFSQASFDVVLQATVFSSILDADFQTRLAQRIWSLIKPGGGVLWYDFVYDNPRNPDVKGVSLRRVRELFPTNDFTVWRLTLAPPISRLVTRAHPGLYSWFNIVPIFRTHVLCWIRKGP